MTFSRVGRDREWVPRPEEVRADATRKAEVDAGERAEDVEAHGATVAAAAAAIRMGGMMGALVASMSERLYARVNAGAVPGGFERTQEHEAQWQHQHKCRLSRAEADTSSASFAPFPAYYVIAHTHAWASQSTVIGTNVLPPPLRYGSTSKEPHC